MIFGFSYIGLIYLIMLFVPNLIWTKNKPSDYQKYSNNENKFLVIFEKIGQILSCCCVLIFKDFNLREWSIWGIWLSVSFFLMLMYELYWIRYFRSPKTMKDFYGSFLKIKVPGATLPVIAFFLLGIYGTNFYLIISSIILGIGHIGIHLGHAKEVLPETPSKKNIFKTIGKGFLIILFPIITGIFIFFFAKRDFNFYKHYKNIGNGVEEESYISLGGQQQYVLITGKNKSNPVIIYLHGGPAGSDTSSNYVFADSLMDEYTFIGWNQRGCGRTYYKNMETDPQNLTVSFEQAISDLDELVNYACSRFNQKKVIIMGHSYGTILGSQYVLSHQDKVSAYIGIGQVVNPNESELFSYEDALKKAKGAKDDTTLLESVGKEYFADKSNMEKLLQLRNLTSKYHQQTVCANSAIQYMTSPYISVNDFKWLCKQIGDMQNYLKLNEKLFDYLNSFNAYNFNTDYQMPVLFISGSDDWICPTKLTEQYKNAISAPEKDFILLNGCGHSCQNDNPQDFAAIVKRFLEVL